MMYYSSWWKLKAAVSWLLPYKRYLKNKILWRREGSLTKQEFEERISHFTLELREAEHEMFNYVQAREFPEVNCPSVRRRSKVGEEANEEDGNLNK